MHALSVLDQASTGGCELLGAEHRDPTQAVLVVYPSSAGFAAVLAAAGELQTACCLPAAQQLLHQAQWA